MSTFRWIRSFRAPALLSAAAIGSLASVAEAQISGQAHASLAGLDATIQTFLQTNRIPGALVAVSKQGRLVMNKAYGLADVSTGRAMTTSTRCRIGSTSKVLSAIGVMKLTEQFPGFHTKRFLYGGTGVLNESFWPLLYTHGSAGPGAAQIRVDHLLSHSSGFVGSGNIPATSAMFGLPVNQVTYAHIHAHFLWNQAMGYAPGTSQQYSNHGMGSTTLVIERTSGQSYADYLRQQVLVPLGLNNVVPTGQQASLLDAAPHTYNGAGNPVVWANLAAPHPAEYASGGWSSSARDLVRLMCAVDKLPNRSDILSPATIDLMESRPYPITASSGAHGWRYEAPKGKLWHNGSVGGGASYIARFRNGYVSANGTNLSEIHVAIVVNIQNASPLLGLSNTVALAAGAAAIPANYDLFTGLTL